ncbi:MAG TPA: regulatory protein RecX [Gaiellaceae bacterium]|jgi:regulatory protein|nr:regulatory protein RecX [Gaiellaceae bacterium]
MPTVTGLHPEQRDRVRVELDGAPWRTLPAAVVVSAGLRLGVVLDRERARELRGAIRRTGALDLAGKALARRDRSVKGLEAVLERRGIPEAERVAAVERLEQFGYLDDDRYAVTRAGTLAGRGYGNEAIEFELMREGLDDERVAAALAGLEDEIDRARRLCAKPELPRKAAARLARRGFSFETIESALGADAGELDASD